MPFLKDKKNLDSFFSAKHDTLRDDLCKKLQIVQEKDAIQKRKKMPLRNNNDDDNLINPIPRVSTPRVKPSFGAWKPYLYRTKTEI